MKKHLLPILILFAFACQGQDSAKHSGRNSISFTCGTNIVYPNTHQINSIAYPSFNIWGGGSVVWNYKITPVASASPWIGFTYNHLLHQCTHFSFAVNLGASYVQYTYKMNATGRYQSWEANDSGAYTAQAQANVFELNVGMSVNYRIVNKFTWHNKLDLCEGIYNRSFPTFTTNAPSTDPFYNATTEFMNTNAGTYLYLFYETGFDFQVSAKMSIMPTVAIPSGNVGFLFENNGPVVTLPTFPYPAMSAPEPVYRSLRTGITVTYYFAGK